MNDHTATAARLALHDIAEDLRDSGQAQFTRYTDASGNMHVDTWFVSQTFLYTIEQRRLNSALGISYINNKCEHLKSK